MFEKVTYRCGHEGEIEVYGKADKRNYVVSMKERDLCPECYKKEQHLHSSMVIVKPMC